MGKKKSKNSISKRYNEEKVWKRSTTILSMLQALEFCRIFFCLKGKFLSLPWDFLHYDTIILQRIRIIVGDAGFEPGTLAPEVWCTKISNKHIFGLAVCTCCCSPRTYLVWLCVPVGVPRGHIWFGCVYLLLFPEDSSLKTCPSSCANAEPNLPPPALKRCSWRILARLGSPWNWPRHPLPRAATCKYSTPLLKSLF